MRIVTIERSCHLDYGTFGDMVTPSGRHYATVERPWLNNEPRVSCIPCGEYTCSPRWYNGGGYNAFEVDDVPSRTYIMFHVGNFVRNSKGCILVNSHLGCSNGELRGVSSKLAFDSFMDEMGKSEFKLIIKNKESGTIL